MTIKENGKRRHVRVSVLVLENKIGRSLRRGEHVGYHDSDVTNYHPDNLFIAKSPARWVLTAQQFICPECRVRFTRSGRPLARILSVRSKNVDYTGPYCSLNCSGKNAARVGQHGVGNKPQELTKSFEMVST